VQLLRKPSGALNTLRAVSLVDSGFNSGWEQAVIANESVPRLWKLGSRCDIWTGVEAEGMQEVIGSRIREEAKAGVLH
jgi:hypothetical protein